MAVIQPCHWCGRPVSSTEFFGHNVCCTRPECQAQKAEADERMQAALGRVAKPEIRVVREDELEAVSCGTCGNGNVLKGAAEGCVECTDLLDAATAAGCRFDNPNPS